VRIVDVTADLDAGRAEHTARRHEGHV
jgi:hypothetical protein